MRVSSGAAVAKGEADGSSLSLRISLGNWPGETLAVELGSLADAPCERIGRDVLGIVAAHLSEADRSKMRLVCRAWARHVRVSAEDAERIARGRARVRGERRAKARLVLQKLGCPLFVVLCLLSTVLLCAGMALAITSEVPYSFSYVDITCVFDVPLAIAVFPVRRECCESCIWETRYRAVISVNNGTAAIDDSETCDHYSSADAVTTIRNFAASRGASSACVRQSPSSSNDVSMATVQSAGDGADAAVDRGALWLGVSTQDFVNQLIAAIVALVCSLLVFLLGIFCLCWCARKPK
jgi:hypothetical protein